MNFWVSPITIRSDELHRISMLKILDYEHQLLESLVAVARTVAILYFLLLLKRYRVYYGVSESAQFHSDSVMNLLA